VLPDALWAFVTEAAAALNCPPDYVAVPMLAMAGGAIANSRRLAITRSHTQSACLYAFVVARPGAGKSPCLGLLREPFDRAQERMLDQWRSELDEWNKADSDERGPRPTAARCVVENTTTESLKINLSQ